MLRNPHDTFSSQSRSPIIVPFHMLGIVSSCAIVTLSSRWLHRFYDIRLKTCHDLEIRVRGRSRSLKAAPDERLCMVSYYCSLVTLSLLEPQLMLTNPCDAFRGQSRSTNSSIPYVRHSFLLCNSNFVFKTVKTLRFSDIQKMS